MKSILINYLKQRCCLVCLSATIFGCNKILESSNMQEESSCKDSSDTFSAIHPLIQSLKDQPNPFLFDDCKNFFLGLDIEKASTLEVPSYFNENIQYRIKNFFNFIQSNPSQSTKSISELKQKASTLNSPENKFKNWEAAELFLMTKAIKGLNIIDARSLINTLVNLDDPNKIDAFLNDKHEQKAINQNALEDEVKLYSLQGRRLDNLRTLIQRIFKGKPKELLLFERMLQNVDNPNVFQGQFLSLNNQDYSIVVNGRIKKVNIEKNLGTSNFKFEVINGPTEYKVNLFFKDKYVSRASIETKSYRNLGAYLNELYKRPHSEDFVLRGCPIIVNEKYLVSDSSILPDGVYDIFRGQNFKVEKGHYIIFKNLKENKDFELEMYCDTSKENFLSNALIKDNRTGVKIYYDHFGRLFRVPSIDTKNIEFKDASQAESFISIKSADNSDSLEIIEKMIEIDKLKNQLVHKLHSECISILHDLLKMLMDNDLLNKYRREFDSILERAEGGATILSILDYIVQLNKELGFNKAKETILEEVLTEANYTLLVNKAETIDTIRILKLLSESHKFSKSMEGRDIISFYGSTGSGKSTSVNYFMGIPLETYLDHFGNKVVKIHNKEYSELVKKLNIGEKEIANIGDSIGTSETIYSKGHPILIEDIQGSLKSVIESMLLCDNPGFHDTRGMNFEICTNLSMDQAIRNCRSIKAVVLVVPYQTFTLDRANHLVDLISLMKERFPSIMQIDSSDSDNRYFHILITKWTNQKQASSFKERLLMHIEEEKKRMNAIKEAEHRDTSIILANERLSLFKTLLKMHDNGQISFINVDDGWGASDGLETFIRTKGALSKKKYVNAMSGGDMRDKFSKQISLSANTWTNLILVPYLEEIPKKINEMESKIKELDESIRRNIDVIKDKKENLREAERDLEKTLKEYKDLKDKHPDAKIDEGDLNIQQKEMEDIMSKKVACEASLDKQKIYLDEDTKRIKEHKDTVKKLTKEKAKLDKNINIWKTGESAKVLVNYEYEYGEEVHYNEGVSQKKRDLAVRNVEEIEYTGYGGSIIAGRDEYTILYLPVISRDYAIVPNKDFDPDGYIQKFGFTNSVYKAEIIAHNFYLKRMNYKDGGKKIVFDIEARFKKCSDKSGLPYLKITHTIPNEYINNDAIINGEAASRKNEGEIDRLNEFIQELEQKITTNTAEKNRVEKELQEYDNFIKNSKNIHTVGGQLAKLYEKTIMLQNNIASYRQAIQDLENANDKYELDIERYKKNIDIEKYNHKRLAFLIRDQMNKQVPQSLSDFIEIAYDLNREEMKVGKDDAFTMAMEKQLDEFRLFNEIYGKNKDTIEGKIKKHLGRS